MNRIKFSLFALIFLFGATFLVSAYLTGIASAEPGSTGKLLIVSGLDSRNVGSSGTCAAGNNCDRCAVPGLDRCAVRDCDRCTLSPYVSGYRCDLNGCAWVREYGCPVCS